MSNKIIYCSDLHGNKILYGKLLDFSNKNNIKTIVIGGDICPHSHLGLKDSIKSQRDFLLKYLVPLLKKSKKNIYIMMGNDDFKINVDVLENAEKNNILKIIHNKLNTINDKKIVGYAFVSEMPFLLKDWEKLDNKNSKPLTNPDEDIRTVKKEGGTIEEDLENIKKKSNPKETIYIIHAPPFNTNLDMIADKMHVGSRSIRKFIEEEQPLLTLHGHIHESPAVSGNWKDKIKETICVNPGSGYLSNKLNLIIIDLDNLDNIEYLQI